MPLGDSKESYYPGQPDDDVGTAPERATKHALRAYARTGSFHIGDVGAIVEAAVGTRDILRKRGKKWLVAEVVTLAVSRLDAELDLCLPEGASKPREVQRGVDALFGSLRDDWHAEQRVTVMAWVELPAEGRALTEFETKAKGMQPARAVADAYDGRLVDRLADVLSAARYRSPLVRAQAVGGLVRAAHLAVARRRLDDVRRYHNLAVTIVSEHP